MAKAGKGKKKAHYRGGGNEGKKVAVISTSHAVVEPNTVMIEGFDTIVANATVIASRWPPYVACLAVLDRNVHGGSIGTGESDHDPIICRGT